MLKSVTEPSGCRPGWNGASDGSARVGEQNPIPVAGVCKYIGQTGFVEFCDLVTRAVRTRLPTPPPESSHSILTAEPELFTSLLRRFGTAPERGAVPATSDRS